MGELLSLKLLKKLSLYPYKFGFKEVNSNVQFFMSLVSIFWNEQKFTNKNS